MTDTQTQGHFAKVVVDFASDAVFPSDEDISATRFESEGLPIAYQALECAKNALEAEIRIISRDITPDVQSWMATARTLQADIEQSRKLASDIVKQAEADEERLRILAEHEAQVKFLEKEHFFNSQLVETVHSIKQISEILDEVESLARDGQIMQPLHILEGSWEILAKIPVGNATSVLRLLETRTFNLQDLIHKQLITVWKTLVNVDPVKGSLVINASTLHESMSLDQAIAVIQTFKELDETAKRFWEDLDDVILKPRTDTRRPKLSSITIESNSIILGEATSDTNIRPLFKDLEAIIEMLTNNLPTIFIAPLAKVMMPALSTRITEYWLEKGVPSSLNSMVEYQRTLLQVSNFADKLAALDWPGVGLFNEWVLNAPKIWLNKRRETALDWARNHLALGVRNSVMAQHRESRVINKSEGIHLSSSASVVNQDWDSAWDSDEEEKPVLSTNTDQPSTPKHEMINLGNTVDDDVAEAWGWGDDDDGTNDTAAQAGGAPSQPKEHDIIQDATPDSREVTLSEKYWASAIPKPLFELIKDIHNDGITLMTKENEKVPVAIAAAGLFGIPTLVLAMYRAISPFHYSRHPSGNMFMYNDSMWFCDQFREYVLYWESRSDLPSRAYGMVKLDPEIKALQSFGKRAYTNEMVAQRTIVADLMGGAQNFLQDARKEEIAGSIASVISYIRERAQMWKEILPYSAWASAVGSLVNTVATKIVSDILDMSGMDVDEAEKAAQLITTISKLDDLFIREENILVKNGKEIKATGEVDDRGPIPLTSQFANNWMKMKFLSEVLQSNLAEIRFLWFESELSLYFTKDEVIDLIKLSFEDNPNSRQLIREVKHSAVPITE